MKEQDGPVKYFCPGDRTGYSLAEIANRQPGLYQTARENFDQLLRRLRSLAELWAARPFSILMFGDSVTAYTARDDDQTPLDRLFSQKAGTSVFSCHGPAYSYLLYEHITRLFPPPPGPHKTLIILPVNLRSLSPEWAARPSYHFPGVKEAVRCILGELGCHEAFAEYFRLTQTDWLLKKTLAFKNTATGDGRMPAEGSAAWHTLAYCFGPAFAEPYLRRLTALCAGWRAAGRQVFVYLSPVNYRRIADLCPPAAAAAFEETAARLAPRLAAGADLFLDCLRLCGPDDFINAEHLCYRGKERLAEALAEALAGKFQPGPSEGGLTSLYNPVSVITPQEMEAAAGRLHTGRPEGERERHMSLHTIASLKELIAHQVDQALAPLEDFLGLYQPGPFGGPAGFENIRAKLAYIIGYEKNRTGGAGIRWCESAEAYGRALSFLRAVTPQGVANVPAVRIGGPGDGGYVMPEPGARGVAYSFGVSAHAPWDIEMARERAFLVYQYDGTVEKEPDAHPNIFFHKFNIDAGPVPPAGCKNLPMIIGDLNHHEENDIILQMDIEGAEWAFFEAAAPEHMRKFKQIIVEFHGLFPDAATFARHLRIISKINQTHQAVHLHCNNFGGATLFPNMFLFAETFEISYARKICPERDGFWFSPRAAVYPTELDNPNNQKYPDIPIGFLDSAAG